MFFLAFVFTWEHRPANLRVSRVSPQCSSSADSLRDINRSSHHLRAYLRADYTDVGIASEGILQEMCQFRVTVRDVSKLISVNNRPPSVSTKDSNAHEALVFSVSLLITSRNAKRLSSLISLYIVVARNYELCPPLIDVFSFTAPLRI